MLSNSIDFDILICHRFMVGYLVFAHALVTLSTTDMRKSSSPFCIATNKTKKYEKNLIRRQVCPYSLVIAIIGYKILKLRGSPGSSCLDMKVNESGSHRATLLVEFSFSGLCM